MAQSSIMLHYGGTFPYTHTRDRDNEREQIENIVLSQHCSM